MSKRNKKSIIKQQLLESYVDEILDTVENTMDYYLGSDREDTKEMLLELIQDWNIV